MTKPLHAVVRMLVCTGVLAWGGSSFAATKYARTTGNWGTDANWSATSCAVAGATTFPTAADDVVICNGITTTVDAAGRAASSVTVETGATATSLTFAAGSSLAVSNNLVINMPTGAVTKQVNVATGTLTVGGNATLTGGSASNRDALLTVSSGSITISGTLTIAATATTSSTVSITGAGSLSVTGAVTNDNVLSIGAGTASIGALTMSTTNVAATTSVSTGSLTVNGNATVNSGATTAKLITMTGAGTLTVNGNLTVTAASATSDAGDATVTVATGTATVTGNLTVTAATMAASSGDATVSVSTGKLSVTGNVTLTGGGNAANDAWLTVSGASAASGGLIIGGTLNIVSTVAGSSTVSATNAASRITVTGAVSNQDAFTVGAGIASTGALTVTNTTGLAATTSVTTGSLTVNGNATINSGTNGLKRMTLTTGTITVNGDLSVTASAATADTGDATVSVTTGKLSVTGKATVTGGSTANRDALLTVTGASVTGGGLIIGGALNIVSTIAGSSTVSATNAASRITVTGAVSNQDTFTVGVGIVSTGALTITNTTGLAATTSVTTGTLTVNGNVTVNSGTNGLKRMTLTTGTITVNGSLIVTAAAATADTGDATVSVTTGKLSVTGTATVTGGSNANRDALLSVTSASPTGKGIFITGGLIITSSAVGSSSVTLVTGSRLTAGSISNGDVLNIGAGIVFVTAEGLTNSNAVVTAAISLTSGTLNIAGPFTNAAGETFTCTAACSILVSGDFTNNGTMTWSTGTLTLNGTAAQTLAGNDPLTIPRLIITNSANPNITLNTNVVVSTTLTGTAKLSNTCPDKTFKSPGQADLHSCQAPNGLNAFDLPSGVASCAALPSGTGTGAIKTKVSGETYSLCVVARDAAGAIETTSTASIKVDVVGNASTGVSLDGNGCPSTLTVLDAGTTIALSSGRASVSFNAVANAWKDARIRLSYPAVSPTLIKCSLDNFAIRPKSLSVAVTDGDWESAGTTRTLNNGGLGGTTHKAGRPFTMVTTAYNGASSPVVTTNYTGTPTARFTQCATTPPCTASFGALDFGTSSASLGVVTTTTATYDNTGSFNLILEDQDYAAVDAADSSTSERYVSSGAVTVGRFVPDHYTLSNLTLTPRSSMSCSPASTFTYMGESFSVGYTLTAEKFGGGTVTLYDGSTLNLTTPSNFSFAADTKAMTSLLSAVSSSGSWTAGATTGASSVLRMTRPAVPDGPLELSIGMSPKDSDGVTLDTGALNMDSDGNGTMDRASIGQAKVRYGRLRLSNETGYEKLPLKMPAVVEHYNAAAGKWVQNEDDSCTSFSTLNGPATVALSAGGTASLRCGVSKDTDTCTGGSGWACNDGAGRINKGDVGLCLPAPGVAGNAEVKFSPPDYLKYLDFEQGQVVFGVRKPFGKSDRILHRSEVR